MNREAYESGGFRERYAMEHGKETVKFICGHKCLQYAYSPMEEYQDANGATYDTVERRWIN